MIFPPDLLSRAKEIRLLLLDVDGVLTDGSLLYSGDGVESKAFNTQDGFGLALLREVGIETGVITARESVVVARRISELKIKYARQGARDKMAAFLEILGESGFSEKQVAYMGDDWLDLKLLCRVGLAAAPANAVDEVKDVVHFVTPCNGGKGAVRNLCDLLVEAHGARELLLARYLH
ncbi:MAG: HAD hydrolase family protein [Desulforhopalus sp.]|nr:HAD hydrolase family protein [Desulforhopalus sp.]